MANIPSLRLLVHQSSHCIWSWRPIMVLGTHFPQNPPHLPYILVPSWESDKEKSQEKQLEKALFAHSILFYKSYLETLNQETAALAKQEQRSFITTSLHLVPRPCYPPEVVLNYSHLLFLFNWSFGFLG